MLGKQRAVLGICIVVCTTLTSRSAMAQYIAALPVGVTSPVPRTAPPVVTLGSGAQRSLLWTHAAESKQSAAFVQPTRPPRRIWYWFTLGGALAGAGTVVGMAAAHCDAGCQDDGGWAYVPYYAGGAALLGGATGTVIGLLVDATRRD